jgi:hypothetical protein
MNSFGEELEHEKSPQNRRRKKRKKTFMFEQYNLVDPR